MANRDDEFLQMLRTTFKVADGQPVQVVAVLRLRVIILPHLLAMDFQQTRPQPLRRILHQLDKLHARLVQHLPDHPIAALLQRREQFLRRIALQRLFKLVGKGVDSRISLLRGA